MAELLRTNDVSLVSVVEGLLSEADIPYHVADRHMSVLDGSVLMIQMRILVPDDRMPEAHELMVDADLGEWVRR